MSGSSTTRQQPPAPALAPGLFEAMVRHSADGMLAVDAAGRILYANSAAGELLGRPLKALLGVQFGLPLGTDEPFEVEIVDPHRGPRVAELRVARLDDGTSVAMLRDVSQRVRLRNELQRLALADQLTGVGNRRAFLTLGSQALKLSEREGLGCILVFVDIDHMKTINDQHGHRAGDAAVVQTSRMLTESVRDADIVARIGGDEFCVLLTSAPTRPESIESALARLRAAAATVGDRVDFPLSVTLGWTAFDPAAPQTIHQLMDAADRAMYTAKRGRQADELG